MTENATPDTEVEAAVKAVKRSFGGNLRHVRNRVIAGIFVVLPVFITFAVIGWLYNVLYHYALRHIGAYLKSVYVSPSAEDAINATLHDTSGYLLDSFFSMLAVVALLAILYIAGMFAQSRLHRVFDWVLLNVPGIKTIYAAVSNVFNSVSGSQGMKDFKRVVLVEFPHPGMKAPAFVTNECVDAATNKTILCVYVPTTPVPTSGYMLMVPEENVVSLNWDLQETLQAIVSGGITVPDKVSYAAPRVVDAPDKGLE